MWLSSKGGKLVFFLFTPARQVDEPTDQIRFEGVTVAWGGGGFC